MAGLRGCGAQAGRRAREARGEAGRHGRLHAGQPAGLSSERCAAMHLGATCFSVYNTSSPEQVEYVVRDAGNRVIVTEQAFLDTVLAAREQVENLEHVVVDRRRGARGDDLDRRAGGDGRSRLRLRGCMAGGRARGRALPDLHLGHNRAAEGGAADARQHGRRLAGLRCGPGDQTRRADDLVPAQRPHRRPLGGALRPDVLWQLRLLLPRPAPDGRLLDRGQADGLGRRAADLGKAEGGDRDRHRGRG